MFVFVLICKLKYLSARYASFKGEFETLTRFWYFVGLSRERSVTITSFAEKAALEREATGKTTLKLLIFVYLHCNAEVILHSM